MIIAVGERYERIRHDFYRWQYALSVPAKLTLSFGFAYIVGLLAQMQISLPWTPVPITGQTLGVLLAGILLGKWWGGISLALYVGLGALGLPWFADWTGGTTILAGPTGGYLIGFIFAALFLGYFLEKYTKSRSFFALLSLMLFANFVFIHGLGLLQLYLWLSLLKGETVGFAQLLTMGTIPFITGDIIKVATAAFVGKVLMPKQAPCEKVAK